MSVPPSVMRSGLFLIGDVGISALWPGRGISAGFSVARFSLRVSL